MKLSVLWPSIDSILWASLDDPKVATTIAWVSPLVNSDEPWVLGRIPVSINIGLTVSASLPSILGWLLKIFFLTISFSRVLNAPKTFPSWISSASGYELTMSCFITPIAAVLSVLSLIANASVIWSVYFSESSAE